MTLRSKPSGNRSRSGAMMSRSSSARQCRSSRCSSYQNRLSRSRRLKASLSRCLSRKRIRPAPAPPRATYKGVCRAGQRWSARISLNGKQPHLGTFVTEEEAARAYDVAARKGGRRTGLNFPTFGVTKSTLRQPFGKSSRS
mmetsp:Transcript_1823/g.6689  ORF Transcript_1823/g.6689 Transcript_1823/m.6689 type:complete len:141 (-) Transcript_1823:270-692(-)